MNPRLQRAIRRIVARNRPDRENAAALDTGSLEVAHALCRERAYILLSTPLAPDMDVLELGAGCGTRTRFLAGRVRHVTALDEDADALRLNALRNRALSAIDYRSGAYAETLARLQSEGARFDLAVLVDVEPEEALLAAIRPLLAADGTLAVACDNPQGVKHWPAADRPPADCGARLESLRARLAAAGFAPPHVAYPYPDHRFPLFLYTDDSLPAPGYCYFNSFPWDRTPPAFDATALWNRLIAEGRFPAVSNSYLLHARPAAAAAAPEPDGALLPVFTKICAIRDGNLRICTSIFRQPDGTRFVEKKPLEAAAAPHIAALARWDAELSRLYAGTPLRVNRGETAGDAYRLEFLDARTLYGDIIAALRRDDTAGALRLAGSVFALLRAAADRPFRPTPEFADLFGARPLPEGLLSAPVTDVDMNFDNFFLAPEGGMTLVDYEFTFDFPVPVDFPVFRSLHYLFRRNPWIVERHGAFVQDAWRLAGIDRALFRRFAAMERAFQLRVHGPSDALYFFHPFPRTGWRALVHRLLPGRLRARVWQALPRRFRSVWLRLAPSRGRERKATVSYAPKA
ncbi:MAG: class I SAM-dependent methyltransferase [Kiritimatiellae bacterium]|nr:class I SAM-dependent methyltransferase [Kiritimatiellia bacterium]